MPDARPSLTKPFNCRHEVSGYPTLKWFKNGVKYDYDGPREEEGLSYSNFNSTKLKSQ